MENEKYYPVDARLLSEPGTLLSVLQTLSFVRKLLQLLQLWGMNVLSMGNTFQPLAGVWGGFEVGDPSPLLMSPKLPVML